MSFKKVLRNVVKELEAIILADGAINWYDVAECAGLSCQTVFNLINGETKSPRFETVWKLAKLVNMQFELVQQPPVTQSEENKKRKRQQAA